MEALFKSLKLQTNELAKLKSHGITRLEHIWMLEEHDMDLIPDISFFTKSVLKKELRKRKPTTNTVAEEERSQTGVDVIPVRLCLSRLFK